MSKTCNNIVEECGIVIKRSSIFVNYNLQGGGKE